MEQHASHATHASVAKGQATREAILAVAIPMFAKFGSRGVSLTQIAKKAGVSKTGLLHHFPTKDALLNAALDVRDEVDARPEQESIAVGLATVDRVTDAVAGWRNMPETIGLFTSLLVENLTPEGALHQRLLERSRRVRTEFADAIRVGQLQGAVHPDVDVELRAIEMIVFLNGLETFWLLDPELPIEDVVRDWAASFVRELTLEP